MKDYKITYKKELGQDNIIFIYISLYRKNKIVHHCFIHFDTSYVDEAMIEGYMPLQFIPEILDMASKIEPIYKVIPNGLITEQNIQKYSKLKAFC